MTDIPLLEPRVLNGVIQDITPADSFVGINMLGSPVGDINPTWEYDIEVENRGALVEYNTPNSEARILDHGKVDKIQGAYAYIRDKKTFNATTTRWLRAAGENEVSAANAERYVLREVEDMRRRHMRGEEIAAWKMFLGKWKYKLINGPSITVDYSIPARSRRVLGSADSSIAGFEAANEYTSDGGTNTVWGGSADEVIENLALWKQIVNRVYGSPVTQAYANSITLSKFYNLPEVKEQLSDRQKDSFTTEGLIPRFQQVDFIEYDGGYVESDGYLGDTEDVVGSSSVYTPYIPDGVFIFFAAGDRGARWEMKYGPSADHSAPPGHTGPFSKTWLDEDPSGRQYLIENNYMPCLFQPNSILIADTNIA